MAQEDDYSDVEPDTLCDHVKDWVCVVLMYGSIVGLWAWFIWRIMVEVDKGGALASNHTQT